MNWSAARRMLGANNWYLKNISDGNCCDANIAIKKKKLLQRETNLHQFHAKLFAFEMYLKNQWETVWERMCWGVFQGEEIVKLQILLLS